MPLFRQRAFIATRIAQTTDWVQFRRALAARTSGHLSVQRLPDAARDCVTPRVTRETETCRGSPATQPNAHLFV